MLPEEDQQEDQHEDQQEDQYEDQHEERHFAAAMGNRQKDDLCTFFTTPTESQRREDFLQGLRNGKQLRYQDRPEYTFNLPLGGRDWGPQMTRIYDATRKKTNLTYHDLNEIAYVFLLC